MDHIYIVMHEVMIRLSTTLLSTITTHHKNCISFVLILVYKYRLVLSVVIS